uniref:Uncharacterized protein n=1 Tax=Oryza barthii TaxID=65489 RepID=A0A0D3FSH6_9ORYZ
MGKAQQKRAQNGPTKHQTLIPLLDPLLLTLGARCSTSLAARVCLVSAVRRFPAPPSDGIPTLQPPAPLACERPVQPPPVGIPAPCTPASTKAATRAVSKLEAPVGNTKLRPQTSQAEPSQFLARARCSTSLAARVCLVSAVRRFPAPPSDGIPTLQPPAPLACERPVQPPPVGIPAPCTPASTKAATRAVSKLEAPVGNTKLRPQTSQAEPSQFLARRILMSQTELA